MCGDLLLKFLKLYQKFHSTPHLFKTERSKLLNKQLRVHNIHYFQQAGIEWALSHYTKHYTYF